MRYGLTWVFFTVMAAAVGAAGQERGIGGTGASTPGSKPQKWAVIIGVGAYEDPGLRPLPNAVRDATAMRDALVGAPDGYAEKNVVLMVEDALNASHRPTRSRIIGILTQWVKLAKAEDSLLVYFAGHGVECDGKLYLLPLDGSTADVTNTAIPYSLFESKLDGSAAKRALVILDACHSGTGRGADGMTNGIMAEIERHAEGRITLASCRENEVSHEHGTAQHGAFTWFLLQGLNGAADANGDSLVSALELSNYTFEETRRWAAGNALQQRPKLIADISGDIVLARVYKPEKRMPVSPGEETQPEEASPSAPTMTPAEVSAARTKAIQARKATERAKAEFYAEDLLDEAVKALEEAESHDTLRQFSLALAKYADAERLFAESERVARRIGDQMDAVEAAKSAMKLAKKTADESQAAEHAVEAYRAAEEIAKQAEAHGKLRNYVEAKAKYEDAQKGFGGANRIATQVRQELAAVDTAESAMKDAKDRAMALDAAEWAKPRFTQAQEMERSARKTQGRIQAARLYDQATELYAQAVTESKAARPKPALGSEEAKTFDGRFSKGPNGVISDSHTGLEWCVGPDRNTDWHEAEVWVKRLTAAGGGWRMPTRKDLWELHKKGVGTRNMDPLFETTGWWVWSGETVDSSSAWLFHFLHAGGVSLCPRTRSGHARAFAVRSRKR